MKKFVIAVYYALGTCFGSGRAQQYAVENNLVAPNYHW